MSAFSDAYSKQASETSSQGGDVLSGSTSSFANKYNSQKSFYAKIEEFKAVKAKQDKLNAMSENIQSNLNKFNEVSGNNGGFFSNIVKGNFTGAMSNVASFFGKGVSTPQLATETPEYTQYRKQQEQDIKQRAQEVKDHPIIETVGKLFGGVKTTATDMAEIHYFKQNVNELSGQITDLNNQLIQEQDPKKREQIGLKLQDLMTRRQSLTDNPPEVYNKTKTQIGAEVAMGGLDVIFAGLGGASAKLAAKGLTSVAGEGSAKQILKGRLGENFGKEIFGLGAEEATKEVLKKTAMTSIKEMLQKEATQKVLKVVGSRVTAESIGAGAAYGAASTIYDGNTDSKSIAIATAQGAAFGWILDRALTGVIKGVGYSFDKLADLRVQKKILNDATLELEQQIKRPLTNEEKVLMVDTLKNRAKKEDVVTDYDTAKEDLKNYMFYNKTIRTVEGVGEEPLKTVKTNWKNIENLDIKPQEPIKLYREGAYETNRPTSWSKSASTLNNPIERTFKPSEVIVDTTDKRFRELFKNDEASLESIKKYNDLEGEVIVKPKIVKSETITPKTATDIEARALEKKLIKEGGLGELPEVEKMKMRKQAMDATELISDDYNKAIRIAQGLEDSTGNLRPGSVFVAVREKALKEGDVITLEKLAKSKIGTEAGQALKAFDAGLRNDPVGWMSDVIQHRTDAVVKRVGNTRIAKEGKLIKENIAKRVRKNMPTKEDWNKFITDITCT